jgi:membrane-bound ClpP family serine protease
MPWKGLTCLLIVVLGLILFLYGANYYDATIGYTGLGFFVGGIVLYIFLKVYESVTKKIEFG